MVRLCLMVNLEAEPPVFVTRQSLVTKESAKIRLS
jgi:hypothetical protein